jgi:hypothetical protein
VIEDGNFSNVMDAARFARERLGFEPDVRQEELLRLDARRVLLNCTRQWGKSTVTAIKALHRACCVDQSLTLVVSPSARQSGEFLRKVTEFARRLGMRARGDGDNAISLLLPNGSRVVGLPGNECTVRGFSAVSLLLIDEASRVEEEMYKALRPMLAVGNGDLWLMSTPFGQRGFFWEEWSKGGEGWLRMAVPATDCPRIPAAFLEEERERMGELWMRQEYMCEFGEASAALFTEDMITRAYSKDLERLPL